MKQLLTIFGVTLAVLSMIATLAVFVVAYVPVMLIGWLGEKR